MIAIVDYGVGNVFSLQSSFSAIGEKAVVTGDPTILHEAERIILPGVGAFSDAARKLRETGLCDVLLKEISSGKPLLGICLGMQLLFERSLEYGEHQGLGLIPGTVKPIEPVIGPGLKVPHMGWNALSIREPVHPLFKSIQQGDYVYFVHSYYAADCDRYVIASADYSVSLTAAAANKNVLGCQFHPEKSGTVGLSILKAFCELKENDLC